MLTVLRPSHPLLPTLPGQETLLLAIGLNNGVLLRAKLDPRNGQLADTRTRFLGTKPVRRNAARSIPTTSRSACPAFSRLCDSRAAAPRRNRPSYSASRSAAATACSRSRRGRGRPTATSASCRHAPPSVFPSPPLPSSPRWGPGPACAPRPSLLAPCPLPPSISPPTPHLRPVAPSPPPSPPPPLYCRCRWTTSSRSAR